MSLGFPIGEVWITNLAEERQETIPLALDGRMALKARAKQIITLELVPG